MTLDGCALTGSEEESDSLEGEEDEEGDDEGDEEGDEEVEEVEEGRDDSKVHVPADPADVKAKFLARDARFRCVYRCTSFARHAPQNNT